MFFSTVYENTAFIFELFAITLFNLWAYRKPFTETLLCHDLGESTFDPALGNGSPKDAVASGAVYNAGYEVDGDVMAEDEKDSSQTPPSSSIVNNDEPTSSNRDRSSYGTCAKSLKSNANQSQSSGPGVEETTNGGF